MEFRTIVDICGEVHHFRHSDSVMMMGSCFSDNMGERLRRVLMDVTVNPFGTLYNPSSIASALRRLMEGKAFDSCELFERDGLWHSFAHHSRFSGRDKSAVIDRINGSFWEAARRLRSADHLIVTFGTAYVYRLAETGEVVANCHKLPAAEFLRERLPVDAIVEEWNSLLSELRRLNPGLRVTLTVSPIRHLADGAHGNRLSKAALLMAADALVSEEEACRYFPSYEIVLDELRDYRFFAADMVHPSEVAVDYVAERFREACFSEEDRKRCGECERLYRRLLHRPMSDSPEAEERFVAGTRRLAGELVGRMPYLRNVIDQLLRK